MLPTTQPVVPPQTTSAGLMTKAISLLDELTKYIVALETRNAQLSAQLVIATTKSIIAQQTVATPAPVTPASAPVTAPLSATPVNQPPTAFNLEHPITHTPPNHPVHENK